MSIFNTGGGGLFGGGNTQQQQQQQQQQQPATGGLFGNQAATGQVQNANAPSLFGGTNPGQQQAQTPSLFGQNTPNTGGGGLFGSNTNTTNTQAGTTGGLFGGGQNQQAGGLFGSNATTQQQQPQQGGLFGQQQPQQQNAGGLFGGAQSQAGGLFGNTNQTGGGGTGGGGLFGNSNQTGAGGAFGNTNQGGGLFGNNNNQQQQPAGGLFGNANSHQQQPAGGLFGGATTQQQQQPGGLFGASNQQQQQQQPTGGGLFGGATQQPTTGTGLFGAQQQQQPGAGGGLFGASTQQQQPGSQTGGGLFGNQQQGGGLFGGGGGGGGLFGAKSTGTTTPTLFPQSQQQNTTPGLFNQSQAQNKPNLFGGSLLGGGQQSALGSSTFTSNSLLSPRGQLGPQQQQADAQAQFIKLTERIQMIYNAWNSASPQCRFTHIFYNLVGADQVPLYTRPQNATDETLWQKAIRENPDPSSQIPVIAIGFDDLRERVNAQTETASKHQEALTQLRARFTALNEKHAISNLSRLQRATAQHTHLTQRLLAFVQHLHLLIPAVRSSSITSEEEQLRGKLEEIEEEIRRGRVKSKLNELWAVVGAINAARERSRGIPSSSGGGGAGGEWAVVDEEGLAQIAQILAEQQAGLAHLTKILQSDLKDLALIVGNSETSIGDDSPSYDGDGYRPSQSTLRASALR